MVNCVKLRLRFHLGSGEACKTPPQIRSSPFCIVAQATDRHCARSQITRKNGSLERSFVGVAEFAGIAPALAASFG
jgi:hypothetical protein